MHRRYPMAPPAEPRTESTSFHTGLPDTGIRSGVTGHTGTAPVHQIHVLPKTDRSIRSQSRLSPFLVTSPQFLPWPPWHHPNCFPEPVYLECSSTIRRYNVQDVVNHRSIRLWQRPRKAPFHRDYYAHTTGPDLPASYVSQLHPEHIPS